ncbi:unnamed protein product [Lupinus luteus]|uniref:Secreted protein n=1 Tax=Lupinus luteus TaxID=3873 RepID=A0AAV1Y8R5_LUPLU
MASLVMKRKIFALVAENGGCPCFFRVRSGRENASSQCSSTRRYNAEVTHIPIYALVNLHHPHVTVTKDNHYFIIE